MAPFEPFIQASALQLARRALLHRYLAASPPDTSFILRASCQQTSAFAQAAFSAPQDGLAKQVLVFDLYRQRPKSNNLSRRPDKSLGDLSLGRLAGILC
jgi:hypothetical protein